MCQPGVTLSRLCDTRIVIVIDHIKAEPLTVSGLFLMYFIIVFRVKI